VKNFLTQRPSMLPAARSAVPAYRYAPEALVGFPAVAGTTSVPRHPESGPSIQCWARLIPSAAADHGISVFAPQSVEMTKANGAVTAPTGAVVLVSGVPPRGRPV